MLGLRREKIVLELLCTSSATCFPRLARRWTRRRRRRLSPCHLLSPSPRKTQLSLSLHVLSSADQLPFHDEDEDISSWRRHPLVDETLRSGLGRGQEGEGEVYNFSSATVVALLPQRCDYCLGGLPFREEERLPCLRCMRVQYCRRQCLEEAWGREGRGEHGSECHFMAKVRSE